MGVFYHQAGDSLTMGLPFYHFKNLFLFISLVPLKEKILSSVILVASLHFKPH